MISISAGRALTFTGLATFAILAAPCPAWTQSVDYGALEQVFNEPVTTSATGKPQRAGDAPADLTIITADDIRRSGATDIPDILRFVTGIDVRQYGATQSEVAVQGYNQPNNPRLLVMVNGRQVYLDDYGYVSWALVPVQLEEIRQIEVVQGPNSALFGFNAASGVINIVTYDPLFDLVNAATLRFGSQALLQGSAVTTMHIGDNVGIRMSVGGLQQDEYNRPANTQSVPGPIRNPALGSFSIDSKVRMAPGLEATFGATSSTARYDDTLAAGITFLDTYHTNSFRLGLMADTAWGTIAVDTYRNWLGISQLTAEGTEDLPVTSEVYVARVSDTARVNADNIVRISLEYRNNSAWSTGLTGGTIGYAVYSASGMWDWQITSALSFTNSVRIDYLALNYSGTLVPGSGFTKAQYNRATIAQPSFNSGLVYKVTDLDTVRLTAGRGLQAPSLLDFGLQSNLASGVTPAFVGSPTLQPTAVWNLELGYDRGVPSIGSTIRSTVFIQRNDRLLTSAFSTLPGMLPGGTFGSVSKNTGYSDAVGSELGIKGHSALGFRWNASYAFELIRDHTTNNQIVLTSPQNYQDGTPTSVVILGGGYTWDKLEVDAQGRWQSRYTDYAFTARGLAPVYIADYVTTRLRVGYNVTDHMTLALTGRQLNVPRLLQSAGPPVERSVIGSVTAHF